jgi:hypothetical protein
MELLTPNKIRSISDGDQWLKAVKLMVNGKAAFTDQQWDVIMDAFRESSWKILKQFINEIEV